MPSSMIFAGLVVVWLLILVPAVARHRQEVARPSSAALSGRVLERSRPRRDPEREEADGVRSATDDRYREDDLEGDRADDHDHDDGDGDGDLDDYVDHGDHWGDHQPDDEHDRGDRWDADQPDDEHDRGDRWGDHDRDHADRDTRGESQDDDLGSERPLPQRYRPGRGGYDPAAAALAARARYAVRQRVVLALLVLAFATAVVAAVALPVVWWAHGAIDVVLVGYLVYLRRQVRLEEAIRERRAQRLARTRRPPSGPGDGGYRARSADGHDDDGDGDDADREDGGRDDSHRPRSTGSYRADVPSARTGHRLDHRATGDRPDEPPYELDDHDDDRADDDADDRDRADRRDSEAEGKRPLRWDQAEIGSALPRLLPAPPPPLPAGTALVEVDEADPDLHELEGPPRRDYQQASGE